MNGDFDGERLIVERNRASDEARTVLGERERFREGGGYGARSDS